MQSTHARTDSASIPILSTHNQHTQRQEAKSKLSVAARATTRVGLFASFAVASAIAGSKLMQKLGAINTDQADAIPALESVLIGTAIVTLPKIVIDYLFQLVQDPTKSRFVTYLIANMGFAAAAAAIGNLCFPTEMSTTQFAAATTIGASAVGLALSTVAENTLPPQWRP